MPTAIPPRPPRSHRRDGLAVGQRAKIDIPPWVGLVVIAVLVATFWLLRPLGLVPVEDVTRAFLVASGQADIAGVRAHLMAHASADLDDAQVHAASEMARNCTDTELKLSRSGLGLGTSATASANCAGGVAFTAELRFVTSPREWQVVRYHFSQ